MSILAGSETLATFSAAMRIAAAAFFSAEEI
jgi:hypothetical protein